MDDDERPIPIHIRVGRQHEAGFDVSAKIPPAKAKDIIEDLMKVAEKIMEAVKRG